MAFRARYRFKILTPPRIEGEPLTLSIPGLPPVLFEVEGEAFPTGHWIVAKIDGFDTEQAAREAGQALGDVLLVSGALGKLGIDIGFSRSTLSFSQQIADRISADTGRELRTEVHGLMVYEKDSVCIVGMEARGSAQITPEGFGARLVESSLSASKLTERQRNCAALINDSFYVPRIEGQFILRISAVEALCDQKARDPRYLEAIEALERQLGEAMLDGDIRETLQRMLGNAKRESLRLAYMTKFRSLRSPEEAKQFDALYQLRSKLVHDGLGRGTLDEASNAALQLATDLLEAELRT